MRLEGRFQQSSLQGRSVTRPRVSFVALEQHSPAASLGQLGATGRGMRSTGCRAQAQELGVRSSCLPCPARAHPWGRAKGKMI